MVTALHTHVKEIETAKIQIVDADGENKVNRDETGKRGENDGANPSVGPPLSTGIENAMVESRIANFLIPAIIR